MENTDGQRKLTSLPESSDDSSQNEQQQGANHGDDRERLSKKTNSTESTQKASEAPRGYVSPSRNLREGGDDSAPPTAPPTLTVSVKAPAKPVADAGSVQENIVTEEDASSNGSLDIDDF